MKVVQPDNTSTEHPLGDLKPGTCVRIVKYGNPFMVMDTALLPKNLRGTHVSVVSLVTGSAFTEPRNKSVQVLKDAELHTKE